MKAPLRPMLLVLGALSLGGVAVLKNAHASESYTLETALDHSKGDGGGGWITLGGKDGGHIELADKSKEGGSIELVEKGGKDGGSIELVEKGGKDAAVQLGAKGDAGK